MLLTNPVLLSVILMCALCLLRVNILISILIAAIFGGVLAGMPLVGSDDVAGVMDTLIGGMGGNAETALSYILLGGLAFAIQKSGLANILSYNLEKVFGKSGKIFLVILAVIACFSQNLIPIHIAFIPILIPSLLIMMNEMKIDRRAAACSLTFGLKAPYIAIPAGFGLIFHGIIADAMTANGMPFEVMDVWRVLWFPVIGMIIGLFIAIFFTYRKPRDYKDIAVDMGDVGYELDKNGKVIFTSKHLGALIGALAAFLVQVFVGSLPLGALTGILIMLAFGTIPFKKMDETINGGIVMMGFIAFVMLVAGGYAAVLRESGAIEELIIATTEILGGSQFMGALAMLFVGLIITMGIGTSFGTIPIIAAIYVPLCISLGFSPESTCLLIGVAAALGDAGSPASDSTLGPTSGLNADGQHDHIWDTCIPTFVHYNIPLFIFGLVGALMFT